MISALKLLLASLLGDFVGRILTGAGLALVTGAALIPLVTGALDAAASALGGIPGDMLAVANMGGIGEGLSIVGAAVITRVGIGAATLGLKKAAGA